MASLMIGVAADQRTRATASRMIGAGIAAAGRIAGATTSGAGRTPTSGAGGTTTSGASGSPPQTIGGQPGSGIAPILGAHGVGGGAVILKMGMLRKGRATSMMQSLRLSGSRRCLRTIRRPCTSSSSTWGPFQGAMIARTPSPSCGRSGTSARSKWRSYRLGPRKTHKHKLCYIVVGLCVRVVFWRVYILVKKV